MHELDGLDGDLRQAGALEQPTELGLVGEPVAVRPGRDPGGSLVLLDSRRLDRLADQPHDQHPIGPLPRREGEVATRDQNPGGLREAAVGLGQVVDDEIADHGVEAAVLEREVLGVANGELELGVIAPGERNHAVGDVDPERDCAPGLGPLRDIAGPVATSSTRLP